MTIKYIKPTILYFNSFFVGLLLMTIFLILVCKTLNFDYKSAISVCLFGTLGYTFKSVLFFLPYFFFYNRAYIENTITRRLIIWSPFMLFSLWYLMIMIFEIEILLPDVSYGYLMRFPHFYLQLMTVFLICIWTLIKFNKIINKEI